MRIELQGPYATQWRAGYLTKDSKGRQLVLLYNGSDNRSTIAYAKYLMTIKLDRFLTDEELVGHQDFNNQNDDINNLFLLTKSECSVRVNKGKKK